MLFIIGVFLLLVAVGMTFRYLRNSRRPKLEAKITQVFYQHVKTDKNKNMRQYKHARVTYMHEGVNYEEVILLWIRAEVGESIQLSHKPTDVTKVELYSPGKELIRLLVLYVVALAIIGICIFVMDFFDLWDA